MKIAFLIIDVQYQHIKDVPQSKIDNACEYINYVSGVLRAAGHPIIHIRDIEGMTEETAERYDVIEEIVVDPSDLMVTKEYSNAFWKTELEEVLVQQGVEKLILAGYAAEHCVLFTYNGAIERGYSPVLLQNGLLSRHDDTIAAASRDRNLISYTAAEWLTQS
ncbi:cysteine hydrolase family protein [Saccharibacillus sacchari]|uniref:cysteine hydrolase family protein n=1 Tax=Saccharibacillus sacchari TaxID=456493 RepID=UPI0004B8748F|nr:isochorismatase family protein [Saccharibacillus sacchari]